MVAINRVHIGGNLTRDPVVKVIANDRQVCNFGIAINRTYKGADGERKEDVTFVEVEAWGRTAELCGQYLAKGRPVYVEGQLTQSTYEKDGVKVSKTRVRADKVEFLGSNSRGGDSADTPAPTAATARAIAPAATATDDEPPF